MGIHDRDYMRRSPSPKRTDPHDRLEAFFGGLLQRHPRLPWMVGGALALVLLAAVLLAVLG